MSEATTKAAPPTTENCRFCWMCRHACPVGHVSHRETYTPHAWALTIESVRRGQLAWNDEAVSVLYACADCGLCQAHCATDQPLPDAIAAARAEVVAAGKAPRAVYELERRLRSSQDAPHAPRPTPHAESSGVALFVGDNDDEASRSAVEAAMRLLANAGINAGPIGTGRSTGAVAASLGLRERAVVAAKAVIGEVTTAGIRELLVLTPGDRWAFEHVYPKRLGVAWPEGLEVREVTAVLADALAGGRLTLARRAASPDYAYHDPCHTARIDRDDRGPRALLDAALGPPAQKMFWRERRAHPCGATSGLDVTHPELAGKLAVARLSDAAAAGATMVITEDPSCLRQLRAHAKPGVEVVGMYELLAEQIQ